MEQPEISTDIIVSCPHCNEFIVIEKLNCCIFRHGIFKETGKQINPHESKELCDYYVNKEMIYGCGRPFKILCNNKDTNNTNTEFYTIVCDYI
jgi:hypothetical protein